MYRKSRNNKNAKRLLKQVIQSKWELKEFEVPMIRVKAFKNAIYPMTWWDLPDRANCKGSWKRHRRSQYKVCL